MNIDTILISEYASVDQGGKLTVVNAFNKLQGPGPRWGIPLLYVSLVVHGPRREGGKTFPGELRLLNANREEVGGPWPFAVTFPEATTDEGMPVRSISVILLAGLVFKAPGAYAFEVYVDGAYAAAHTLYVKQIPPK